jgi:capsular polysaccharide biosynthesis protein
MRHIKRLIEAKTFDNKLPVNFIEQDRHLFETHIHTIIPQADLYEIENVLLLPEIILFKNGRIKKIIVNRNIDNYRYLIHVFRRYLRRKTKKLEGKYLFVIDNWSNGYYHWTTDVLQRLLLVEGLVPKNIKVLLPEAYRNNEYMTASISLFGYEVSYFPENYNYKIEQLLIPGHAGTSGVFDYDTIRRLSALVLERTGIKNPSPASRRIYISRKQATRRRLANEEELTILLSRFGFETVVLEALCFIEQVRLINDANYLISLHGAGLTNILFMQKGNYVMEIRHPKDYLNNCYYLLSTALEQHYSYFLGDAVTDENPHYADISVDVHSFHNCLTEFLNIC